MNTIVTGTDVVRQTLRHRRHGGHIGWIARDTNASVAELDAFIDGSKTLKPELLQKLTALLFHGTAVFDEKADRLRKSKPNPGIPLCSGHPPVARGVPFVKPDGMLQLPK